MGAVAAALFVLSAVSLGGAGWLYWRSLPALSELVSGGEPEAARQCANAASALGFQLERQPDGSLVAKLARMGSPQLDFGRASALIATCRGYRLAEFCAGLGCGASQMQIRLAPAAARRE